IEETNRRRAKQLEYNAEQGISPTPLRKKIADITDMLAREDADTEQLVGSRGVKSQARTKAPVPGGGQRDLDTSSMPVAELSDLVQELDDQMHAPAAELQFEVAARLRDEVSELKKELRQMVEAGAR